MTALQNISLSGDYRVDSLLWDIGGWNYVQGKTTIYYEFDEVNGFNSSQRAAALAAMNSAKTITGITFAEASQNQQADLKFGTKPVSGGAAYAEITQYGELGKDTYRISATIWVDSSPVEQVTNATPGTFAYEAIFHELGHVLGLKHSFSEPNVLPKKEDNTNFTLMSYTHAGAYKTDFQVYDIMALKYLYGGDGLGGMWGVNSANGPVLKITDDKKAPAVVKFMPVDGGTNFSISSNIELTFSEGIKFGSGKILLKLGNGTLVETYSIGTTTSSNLKIDTVAKKLSINPTMDLTYSTTYLIEISPGALLDAFNTPNEMVWGYDFTTTAPGVKVLGTAGNDTFSNTGSAANDTFDGGKGFDRVVYNAPRANFTLSKTDKAWLLTDKTGALGVDSLSNIERIQFSDFALAFDLDGNAGKAYRLYQAAFDRTPDLPGLGWQLKHLDAGMTILQLAENFTKSAEFQKLYGINLQTGDFVGHLYQNVLDRMPETAGFTYWSTLLDTGKMSRAEVLYYFSESAENQAQVIGSIQNGIEYMHFA